MASGTKSLPESLPENEHAVNANEGQKKGNSKAAPVSSDSKGRKRRSCVKAEAPVDSAKGTKIKKSKAGLEHASATQKLKKTRLDFTEAV
jgi:hypothetical protein